jgi:TonB-linked SusC/RagA family outer membrane protein
MSRSSHQLTRKENDFFLLKNHLQFIISPGVKNNKNYSLRKVLLFLVLFIFPFELSLIAQQKIRGIITGSDGFPIQGVSVSVKAGTMGTMSGEDGSFSISAKKGDILVFSSVGFKQEKINVENDTIIKISLSLLAANLNEVVVTGYTAQKIKEIAGSVAVVNPKQLIEVPAGQTEQMLQGRVAGLTVITTGEPGSSSNIRIHGIGNFGDVTPLYIIDGVQGDINSLNPYDIESLQVLKDAGAYAIYGVRGSNGVIVVTTKKGKAGKTKINYDFYIGVQEPLHKGLDMLNPQEHANLLWLAKRNSYDTTQSGNPYDPLYGGGPVPILPDYSFAGPHRDTLYEGSPYVADSLYNLDVSSGDIYQIVRFSKTGVDWFHTMYQPAVSQNHTLSVSGGSENNHYLFSVGYLDQEGTMINTYLKRFTARINSEFLWLKTLHLGENLQLAYIDNPMSEKDDPRGINFGSDLQGAIVFDPSAPIYDIKGAWNGFSGTTGNPNVNPVARRFLSKDDKTNHWQIFGNAYAQLDFLKYFSARTNFGGTLDYFYDYNFIYPSYDYVPSGSGSPNSFSESSGYNRSWTWTNTINYSQHISNAHSIKILAGIEQISNYDRTLGGQRVGFFINDPNYRFLSNGDPVTQTNYSMASTSKFLSFISKLDYSYLDKYILTATIRRDGSSIFGSDNRYGWFPAVAMAWRMTEENFLRSSTWLTDLKLRASWGKSGYYGNTDPFNQYTLYGGAPGDATYDIYGNSTGTIAQGFRMIRIGNPETGWQEDVVTNIGFESIFWNGKLSITADWFNKQSNGLLFPLALPDLLGDAIRPTVNVGGISNKGIDLLVGSKGNFSRSARWDLQLTFTSYKSKVLKLNDIPYFDDYYGYVRNQVGYPVSSYFGYKIAGYFNDTSDVHKQAYQDGAAPGRFRYQNVNSDSIINDADRIHIGDPNPLFTLGINIGFAFKNFDFSTFCYWSYGNDVLNLMRQRADIASLGGFTKTALYDSWTPQHTNAKSPIAETSSTFSSGGAITSYPIEKGSYFRNKSMILGFNFPKSWINKMPIERIRVYFQVTNLFTITNYTGLDPELPGVALVPGSTVATKSTFGIDDGNYPNNQRQYLFGLSVGL